MIRPSDLKEIRRTVLFAIASDDVLSRLLVLKGGNALALVHGIGRRSSLDIDYSLSGDLDEAEAATRLQRALADRFDAAGLALFDFKFSRRPAQGPPDEKWGGYNATFKLISRSLKLRYRDDIERMRREAVAIGPRFQRVFEIEISKHECCEGTLHLVVDGFPVSVCSPLLIAIEKLRAICQQMIEYGKRKYPAPRSRDFYDIHSILTEKNLDLNPAEVGVLVEKVFLAKEVPIALLGKIDSYREFHRQDWVDVKDAVQGEIEAFDYYFDFVVKEVAKLQALWNA